MNKKILASDKEAPAPIKNVVPEIEKPEEEIPTIDVLEFTEPGQTAIGMYNGNTEDGHLFTANGRQFLVGNSSPAYDTVNAALQNVKPNSTKIQIEFLGQGSSKLLFEVVALD